MLRAVSRRSLSTGSSGGHSLVGEHDRDRGNDVAGRIRDRGGDTRLSEYRLVFFGREAALGDLGESEREFGGIRHGVAGEAPQRLAEHLGRVVAVVGEQDLAHRGGVRGDGEPGLEHLLAAVGATVVVDDDDLVEQLGAEPHGESGAPGELARPAHGAGAHVERVEVDVAQLQQCRAEHVAVAAALFRHQAVLLQRLHDAVHGGGGKLERGRQFGDSEVACALQRAQHLRGAVNGLDHRHPFPQGFHYGRGRRPCRSLRGVDNPLTTGAYSTLSNSVPNLKRSRNPASNKPHVQRSTYG